MFIRIGVTKYPSVGLNIEKKSVIFSFVVEGGLLKISSSFEP